MLENYYVRPVTIDRIRGSWIAPAIEQYVGWLAQQRFTSRSVLHRVPILVSFGEFAKAHGARELGHLPAHVEPFVVAWVSERAGGKSSARRKKAGQEVRNPIRQMLRLAIPGYIGLVRPHKPNNPFEQQAPQFLTHLAEEKGLRPRSMLHYRYHLHQFATYLQRIGIDDLATLSPTVLSGFIAEYAPPRVAWTTARNACGTLRVLLRYLHREGVIAKDLSALVEFPRSYRHAGVPRSISWEQVEKVLSSIDRRSASGKRDYAMLLLLATYGLRACEVAALTLDDIDWRNERLKIRDRKAGNTPLPIRSRQWWALLSSTISRTRGRPRHAERCSCAPRLRSPRSGMRRWSVAPPTSSAKQASAYLAPVPTCCGTAACSVC